MIVGVLLVLALLVGMQYFALGPGAGTTGEQDVNVTVPEVDVNIQRFGTRAVTKQAADVAVDRHPVAMGAPPDARLATFASRAHTHIRR